MLQNLLIDIKAKSQAIHSQLDSATENNARKQELVEVANAYKKKLNTLQDYSQRLDIIVQGARIIMDTHRNECIENLQNRMAAILAVFYPDEAFHVRISYHPVRGKFETEVDIGKENGEGRIVWDSPRAQNGDFVKQLVSFSMIASINILLHAGFLFMDEPFSSSDTTNVSKLRYVFGLMQELGLQLLFIEHKPELYRHIEHNLIQLQKHRHPTDPAKGYVEVVSIERREPDGDDNDTDEGPAS